MQNMTLNEIRDKALLFDSEGVKWHFHLLTPSCKLDSSDKYAFVLECASKDFAAVYYSDKAEKELAKELSPLVHGKAILDKMDESKDYHLSEGVQKMVTRAKNLNTKGIEWHHHLLFPDCIFNTNKPQWTLTFEDDSCNGILEYKSKDEPKNELKQIEILFFAK